MWRTLRILGILSVCWLTISCHTPSPANAIGIKVGLSSDSTAIILNNIPEELLAELQKNPLQDAQWQQIFSVHELSTNPDLPVTGPAITGDYEIRGQRLQFRPQVSFKKGSTYLVTIYIQNRQLSITGLLKPQGRYMNQQAQEYKFSY